MKQCLIKGCKVSMEFNPSRRSLRPLRGLCYKHYGIAKHQIFKGKTTWYKLEEIGMAVPPSAGNDTESMRQWRQMLQEKSK